MDPILKKFGDVTIQRLEKPKDPKETPQSEATIQEKIAKPAEVSEKEISSETLNLKRSFPDSQISIKKFKLESGSVTLEKKITKDEPVEVKKVVEKPVTSEDVEQKRKLSGDSENPFSDTEISDFESESDIESDVDAELNSVEPKEVPKEDSEDDSTSTSFLEKLVEEPFQEAETVPPKPLDSSVENEDYDFDIKEKLKEMGEISFQTVKKGEKPKKVEVSTENEVVVTPARKPGDDEGTSERKGLNLRRNIREVMDETKLDESTLAAQRQEMERLQRVQEQQRLLRDLQRQAAQERMQHKVISLLQGNNFSKPGPSSTRIGNTVLVKLPNGQTKPMTRLPKRPFDLMRVQRNATLGQMGAPPRNARGMVPIKRPGANLTPSVSIAPVSKRFIPPAPKPHSDSESEEDVKPPMRLMKPHHAPVQTIDISSDEDCIVVSEPEGDHGDDGEDDPSNSGMHTHDEFNQPDDQGRVVVNIGHPEDEPDIFVAPQISRIIKPHQIGGVRFLYDNVVESTIRFKNSSGFGCILAHSMGLGKTLQVVCFSDIFLRHTPAKTILCIMPINTLQNWLAEYNMWLPTEDGVTSSPLHVHGEVRARKFNLHVLNDSHKTLTARHKVIHAWKTGGGVLLIGYEQFRLLSLKKHPKSRRKPHLIQPGDDDKNKAMFDDVHEALVRPGPDLVICDEGHRIKNSHASISQALKNMSTKRRVVLTGYPLQNNLMEYWCMVDFVRPNYLGTKTEFCNMFERPIMNGQCIDSTEADIKLMRYRAHVLHSLLVGFVQRRSHTVLQTALPQKEEYVLLVRMTPFQRKLYETFMDVVIRADLTPNPLKAFAVCCKIWNHPDVMYYFLEKRKSKGDAIDIDLEEVAAPGVISEAPTKPKKAPARPRKSTAKNKNGAKPAASVTPYNSSSEVLNQAQTNSTDPANVPTMATSFSGIIPQQENNTEPMPISQNSTNSFPSTSQNLSECPQPTNQTPYAQEQQQQQQQQSPRFPLSLPEKSPLDEIANFDPIASFGQSDDFNISSQNESDKATNSFLNAFTTDASNSEKTFLENIGEPTPQSITSNLDFINSISDNSQYTPQGQSTNVMADNNAASSAPSHFDLGFDQGNYPNFWGQPNDDFNLHTDFFGNSQPAETFNPNFSNSNANQAWVKKEEAPSVASSVRSENSNDSKPKINIISDIKLPCVFTPPTSEKKIKILSDIKIEPKIEESNDDKLDIKQELKKLAIKDELKTESKLSVEEDKIGDKILSDAMSSTRPMISNLKEDTSIPYDWAVELLKDYVPGIIENSAKMEILFCIIRESLTLGDRILIFSQSLITLDLIEQFLQTNVIPGDTQKWARNASYYRLDGSTSALEREKLINEFNSNPKIHLFLVSTRAGSLGINLVGANRVVVLDASWNPCHDTQAVCRVYRYGQRKPCFVYRLVVDNCLEKKIYDRQINKQGMSDRVVDECNPDAHLTMKDVSTLCWDEKMEEAEEKDWSHVRDNYIDVVLQKVIEKHGRRFTKEPFQHESLLVDRKEKQLSQQEKRLAKKGYEREKQAARQPAYNLLAGGRNRPIASVRPMQQGNERPSRWIPAEHWQRQGMTAQEMTLPLDVVIPTNQPEKGNIVLKAGQKVLVLKSPKGVYMQLESGKIVAIKTAIKVKGKAEDNHDPTKMMRPHLPPMMRPNQPTQPVMPQKKIVRPFTPGVAKMNVRSIRQSVPNLVSRIQSLTKKDQISSKSRPFQTGMDAIKALQKDHEQFPSSSSDEEHAQSERRKQQNHLDIVLPNREKYPTAEDFGKRYSLLKKQVSIRRVGNPQAQQEPKSASALQRLEQTTTSVINDDMPFQETLDSITSSYKDDNIEDDVSMASSLEPKPSQIASDASEENSDEVTYVSEQPAPPQHYPPNAPQSNVKDGKNEAPSGDYSGYNYNYNYNMQPYHAPPPPPPPQGYVYPGQHPPPYDMMGYPPQPPPPQPPQYNYGYQGYHPPPQPHYAPPPPPPPQGNYDYTAAPPQPIYSGYHNPYPPQPYAPPPPQNMYPAPQAPATAPNYPEYPYNANNPAPATPFYPNT